MRCSLHDKGVHICLVFVMSRVRFTHVAVETLVGYWLVREFLEGHHSESLPLTSKVFKGLANSGIKGKYLWIKCTTCFFLFLTLGIKEYRGANSLHSATCFVPLFLTLLAAIYFAHFNWACTCMWPSTGGARAGAQGRRALGPPLAHKLCHSRRPIPIWPRAAYTI